MSDRFTISADLAARLRRGSNRATVPFQLGAALPNGDLQTMAVPPSPTHVLEYSIEVSRDNPAGQWRMGDTGIYTSIGYLFPIFWTVGLTVPQPTYLRGYFIAATDPVQYGVDGAISTELGVRQEGALRVLAGGGVTVIYFPIPDTGSPTYYPGGGFSFSGTQDFTWELWLRTTQAPAGPVRILEQESGGVFPFRIQMLANGKLRASRSDGTHTPSLDSAQAVNDGAWRYVTYSKSGSTLRLQVDRNAAVTTADTVTGDTSLTVDGALAGDGFEGDYDELAVYRTALADPAKLRHWNAAKGIPA